jgi:hypothetical protein
VIGMYTGLLCWIDADWLTRNANRIFDLEGPGANQSTAWGWAAWNSFLVSARPHVQLFRALRQQFRIAVTEAVAVHNLRESDTLGPFAHLGQHLVLLYGRGQLGFDDEDGLLRRFLTKAAPWVRRKAMTYVGEALHGSREVGLPHEMIKRYESLWDFYWASIGESDAREEQTSSLFGQWFTCALFPVEWSLDRLEQFVSVVPKPRSDREIVQRLAEVCGADPAKAVSILDKLARGDDERWRIGWWKEDAMTILGRAIKSGGEARMRAEQLVDYLGRRGFTEFGRLLAG